MALQSITVTFPANIPPATIIKIIEGNMKANSIHECSCQFKENSDGENDFLIWADCNEAFYQIGMTASEIIRRFS